MIGGSSNLLLDTRGQGFDCGKSSLNDFLHVLVTQYEKRNLGRTYVATREGDRARASGYYTLGQRGDRR